MYKKVERVFTDAAFVDSVSYYAKILAINSVIKDEERALNCETKETSINGNIYIACKEGRAKWYMFSYTKDILIDAAIPEYLLDQCVKDPMAIPESKREELCNIMVEDFLEKYEEKNDYYRQLAGLPNYGDPGIPIQDEWIPYGLSKGKAKYLHELDADCLMMMENLGTLESIISMYIDERDPSKYRYLDHMGVYAIDPYDARKAEKFQILYLPSIDHEQLSTRYRILFERNRVYFLRRVYSDAIKYTGPLEPKNGNSMRETINDEGPYKLNTYDAFIMVYLTITTIIDLINEIPNFITHKEVFDARCIRYLFESYGLPYYSEIPTKYQLRLIKNINILIKYKSSRRNMIDICNIFGFENIKVFKYYILRDRKTDKDGNYIFAYKDVPDPDDPTKTITIEDPTQEYELKFIKMPIDDNPDEYIKKVEDHISYDIHTINDYWWDGEDDHQVIKDAHLNAEFSCRRSKYISIDTTVEMKALAFDLPYFYNLLYDIHKLEEYLLLSVPYINTAHRFRLTDLFIYLFAMNDLYNMLPDYIYTNQFLDYNSETGEYTIRDVEAKVEYDIDHDYYYISNMDDLTNSHDLSLYAFNIMPDTEEINRFLAENFVTWEDVGIKDFKMYGNPIVRYEDLLAVFNTNKGVHDHIVKMMANAETEKEHALYEKIYKMLMTKLFQLDYFIDQEGHMPRTYTEYLQNRDSLLYISLVDVSKIEDKEARRKEIDSIVSQCIYAIDEYIDTETYKNIFSNLPTVSTEYIKKYVAKIIEIFKSYKIQLYDISSSYRFADSNENLIRPTDYISNIHLTTRYTDKVEVLDNMIPALNTEFKEYISIGERVSIRTYKDKGENE